MSSQPPGTTRPLWFWPVLALVILAGLCSLTAILVVTVFTVAPVATTAPSAGLGATPDSLPTLPPDLIGPTLSPAATSIAPAAAIPSITPAAIPTLAPIPATPTLPPPLLPPAVPTPAPLPLAPPANPQPAPVVYYHVINRHSQKCLAAQDGTQWIVQEACDAGAIRQLWSFPRAAGSVSLLARTGVCVGLSQLNNKLVKAGCSIDDARWTLVPLGQYYTVPNPLALPHAHATIVPQFIGTYYLVQSSGQCIDDDSWSHVDGQVMIHDDCRFTDNDNQLWGVY